MTERIPKIIFMAAAISAPLLLAYFAYSRPGYFTSQTYLGGLLFLELLAAALWMYRRVYYSLVMTAFLLAGMYLPFRTAWTTARWVVLGVGASVGLIMVLKERRYPLSLFHLAAFFAVLAAAASAAVSHFTSLSSLKVLSLLLLFLYGATGARVAVAGRENRFFAGLLLGCEIFVGIVAAFYLGGYEVMGNPNSLGAVMGVVGAPMLLWGILVAQEPFAHRRRVVLYILSMYMTYASQSRASMVAAFISCGLLCVALRRYRLLTQGLVLIAILVAASAILRPEGFSRTVSSLTSTILYKGKDRKGGLLGSRQSPWQDAVDTIHNHFWFGTGFGTSDTGSDSEENLATFSSEGARGAAAEHGSSYLEITTWVGMVGLLPFSLLLLILLRKVVQTVRWMLRTANPAHPAVPLAMVMLAGMLHAGLEDWLFAPGYYLCVFYWTMAFVLVDYTPSPALADSGSPVFWRDRSLPQGLSEMAPNG